MENKKQNCHYLRMKSYSIVKTLGLNRLKAMNKPGVVVHACNPSAWEPKAGASRIQGSRSYTVRPYLQPPRSQKLINKFDTIRRYLINIKIVFLCIFNEQPKK